jgi:hypothetical protein
VIHRRRSGGGQGAASCLACDGRLAPTPTRSRVRLSPVPGPRGAQRPDPGWRPPAFFAYVALLRDFRARYRDALEGWRACATCSFQSALVDERVSSCHCRRGLSIPHTRATGRINRGRRGTPPAAWPLPPLRTGLRSHRSRRPPRRVRRCGNRPSDMTLAASECGRVSGRPSHGNFSRSKAAGVRQTRCSPCRRVASAYRPLLSAAERFVTRKRLSIRVNKMAPWSRQ